MGSCPLCTGSYRRTFRQKLADLADEASPGRIAWQEDVVAAIEGDKPGTGDTAGDHTPLLEWERGVVSAVQHQRRRRDRWQEVEEIEIADRLLQGGRICSGGRNLLQIIQPTHLVIRGIRQQQRCEDLSK